MPAKNNPQTVLYTLGIIAMLLANTIKFHRFESEQNLISFLGFDFFFRLLLVYFAVEASNVFNLFLNFEQK